MAEKVTIGNAERVWIYALCDPVSDAPRYVGKTHSALLTRMRQHKRLAARKNRTPLQRWLNVTHRVNLCGAYMRVLESAHAANWAEREQFWIAYGRAQGWRLLNVTDGGEGLHGLVPTNTHRLRNSEAHKKGAMFTCACGAQFWRKPSAIAKGQCKFCSRACYQAWQIGKPKAIPKGAVPWNKGRSWTPDERRKISEGRRHAVR